MSLESKIDNLFEIVRELQAETSNIWVELEKIRESIRYTDKRM